MVEVHGFCDERFRALADFFRENLECGLDKGASLAVTLHGEPVVDLWGGTRDYALAEPWESDTVVRVFSSSKPMVVICVLMLVDRGVLDLDAPIAQYWPEFARHGKSTITPRQVLTHTSGLPGFGKTMTFDELADWGVVIATLEDAQLWYVPGTMTCYAPFTFGHVLGELVRRLGGVPFEEFFRREVAEPMGADFRFSTPSDETRTAAIWPAPNVGEIGTPMGSAVMAEPAANSEWVDPAYFPTVIPAASGITNARAIARITSMLAMGGELDGRRYLSQGIVDEASSQQHVGVDELLGPVRYGLGFGLHSVDFPAGTPTTFHWGGYGGSFVTMDQVSGISAAFTPNQLLVGDSHGSDPRLLGYFQRLGEVSDSVTGRGRP